MDIEETENTATTAISPQQMQGYVTAGLGFLKQTTSPYSDMVKKHGSDWTKWPQTSNWYKALYNFQLAHDKALLCVYSDYGVSGYTK